MLVSGVKSILQLYILMVWDFNHSIEDCLANLYPNQVFGFIKNRVSY
jgi:hypothetical protein